MKPLMIEKINAVIHRGMLIYSAFKDSHPSCMRLVGKKKDEELPVTAVPKYIRALWWSQYTVAQVSV